LILALDTSTAACTAALLERDGTIVASRDELIGRGHAERLVPMIEEMLDGHVPSKILVGVGPGSFTGLRVGIAAAHGMAIGWSVPLSGMNSLALLAATAPPGEGQVAAFLGRTPGVTLDPIVAGEAGAPAPSVRPDGTYTRGTADAPSRLGRANVG